MESLKYLTKFKYAYFVLVLCPYLSTTFCYKGHHVCNWLWQKDEMERFMEIIHTKPAKTHHDSSKI